MENEQYLTTKSEPWEEFLGRHGEKTRREIGRGAGGDGSEQSGIDALRVVYQRGRISDGERILRALLRNPNTLFVQVPGKFPLPDDFPVVTVLTKVNSPSPSIFITEQFIVWPSEQLKLQISLVAG